MDPKARSSPGLKVTIKNSATDRSAPAVTIQNFAEVKDAVAAGRVASSGFKPGGPAAAGSISTKSAHKINERFITDPGAAQRSEERKRSGDSASGGMVARRKLGKILFFFFILLGTGQTAVFWNPTLYQARH
jgi:hypothetical protein